ncbi:bacterial alpha-L-rhamnosidase-domain-containing protein [Boeremia exigua]|uniref:bacterial alpha-L-rhamnosidase-domain-containing protein n=1 Tax=Boeremia exigua TaxID=749465 RepID=UPI001E8E13AF|nr:bacterial alpha-L-rhamnosidase-domain-containing protein [Boeremia exigua]KAH6622367.1 bacterial alpha-L-rhamnosidase-domain-containing protein [Boeremia exigua]
MTQLGKVRFEHYQPENALGVHETQPRISWTYNSSKPGFQQRSYNVELTEISPAGKPKIICSTNVTSSKSNLVPWPADKPLRSRQRIAVKIQGVSERGETTSWSEPSILETGLLDSSDWTAQRITGGDIRDPTKSHPERLFRKSFDLDTMVASARLYITAQGLYEAEINGVRVGDYFLAPGFTEYKDRLQYQTYDVSKLLRPGNNCIGVRVAEGWYNGRIGFEGGRRNIWGDTNAFLAQLEVTLNDESVQQVVSDVTWAVTEGPIRIAELYDGEKYDATKEVDGWSLGDNGSGDGWQKVKVLDPLPERTKLVAGYGEPVRRIETVKPIEQITTPSGKTVLDFGQNLVGYVRINKVRGTAGHKITLKHAEVLEHGELGTRPLRDCKATDEYILKGSPQAESWEPRFTFHGFRYAQVDNWPEESSLADSIEAVVCHTDMQRVGHFECSDINLNKLYQNVCWSMRGNFLSIPTDCPQRDERLGWTGDLALFAPTAAYVYQCAGILKNWHTDLAICQKRRDGLPPMVCPDPLEGDKFWDLGIPTAIWHDVTVLGPWAMYRATGDVEILRSQYESMQGWISKIQRYEGSATPNLWHPDVFQLGDWLDPAAPPDCPWQSKTDSKLASDAFLVHTLHLMTTIATLLAHPSDATTYKADYTAARAQFQAEWTTPNGRLVSDSQTAYALALTFDLLTPAQRAPAGDRLAHLVRLNSFKIGTGFAGTPYVCEALVATGHAQVAYGMLLADACPSWLYGIRMGATTTWERWDSMLPDGSVNQGDMTSFNHYAYGAVATFLHERVAGLRCLEPGWERVRVEPVVGGDIGWARARHEGPRGEVGVNWKVVGSKFKIEVVVPEGVTAEVCIPDGKGKREETVGCGRWEFETAYERTYKWPVDAISPLPPALHDLQSTLGERGRED